MRNVLCSVPRLSDEASEKLGEEFRKHEKIIDAAVRYFQFKYCLDYDSLYAAAVGKLLLAYHRYDPLRSEWEKYLKVQIMYGLKDEVLSRYKRKHKTSTNIEESFFEVPVEDCASYDMEELQENLTPDARYVLKCVLESDMNTAGKRMRVVQQRTRAMGWTRRRTDTAFAELRCMIEAEI
ncbi:MAG: hypothetical protein LBP87_07935 [Planctomycetaceae bacterium]|nr:hypothetical protein [Planctomycetaceae bacterium]